MSGHHKQADAPAGVSLPITPMLDMPFQLLMFFIFTYNAAAHEGQINVALPSQEIVCGGPDHRGPAEKDDLVLDKVDLNVRVHARQAGCNFTLEEGPISRPVENLEALRKHLTRCFKHRADAIHDTVKGKAGEQREALLKEEFKKVSVKVQGDAELRWTEVIGVMDTCRQTALQVFREAGFDVNRLNVVNIGFAPPPPRGGAQ